MRGTHLHSCHSPDCLLHILQIPVPTQGSEKFPVRPCPFLHRCIFLPVQNMPPFHQASDQALLQQYLPEDCSLMPGSGFSHHTDFLLPSYPSALSGKYHTTFSHCNTFLSNRLHVHKSFPAPWSKLDFDAPYVLHKFHGLSNIHNPLVSVHLVSVQESEVHYLPYNGQRYSARPDISGTSDRLSLPVRLPVLTTHSNDSGYSYSLR